MTDELSSPGFKRPQSLRDLAKLRITDLETWLTRSAILYSQTSDPADRMEAFDPLIIPQAEHPARFVAAWWQGATNLQKDNFSEAVANAIETLNANAPMDAAILIFGIATHFASARKLVPVLGFLSRTYRGDAAKRYRLGQTIAHWARRRGESQDMVRLAHKMDENRMLDAIAAIELLTYAAISDGPEVIPHFKSLMTEWFGDGIPDYTDQQDVIYAYFANTCVDTMGVLDAFLLSLQAQERKMPQMRQALEANRLVLADYSASQYKRQVPLLITDRISQKTVPFSVTGWKWNTLSNPDTIAMTGQKIMLNLNNEFKHYSLSRKFELDLEKN